MTAGNMCRVLFVVGIVFSFPFVLSSPCAEIASSFGGWESAGGRGDFNGIEAGLAHDCLRSIPLDQNLALEFLEQYRGYLQFHSTVATLKNAPPSYLSPTVDLWGGLDRIRNRIISGAISSQYDFDNSLHRLINQANDGHLQIGLCSLELFRFQHGVPLASISRDGLDLPELYVHSDAATAHANGRAGAAGTTSISPVVEINGLDADYYLQSRIAVTLAYHDPDARYNALFPSPSDGFIDRNLGGAWVSKSGELPGAAVMAVRLANGTRLEVRPTATWPATNGPMNYTSGRSLFEAACRPGSAGSRSVFGSFPGTFLGPSAYELPPSGPGAYPTPTTEDADGLVRLYALDDPASHDVAVLQVTGFRTGGRGSRGFSAAVRRSLGWAARNGKTRLLLDMSGNGGGDVIPGFDLFRALFPDQPIRSATRFRSTELVDVLGQAFSGAPRGAGDRGVLDPPLAFQDAVGPDQERGLFGSWEDLFGPDPSYGRDNMSRAYAVFDLAAASTARDPIGGYGAVAPAGEARPFSPEDMAVMTDGRCASTCAVVVGLLQAQGVRTLALGGRPRRAPMQAVGGVKGGQRWSLRAISRHIQAARELLARELELEQQQQQQQQQKYRPHTPAALRGTNSTPHRLPAAHLLQRLDELAPPALPPQAPRGGEDADTGRGFALRFDTYGQSSVNFRDAYVPAGGTGTPWQFVYEAADCRLFLTLENVMEPSSRWVSAARAMFGGGECVEEHTSG